MRYLCLGFHDEKAWQALTERERKLLVDETLAYGEFLRASGHLINDLALEPATTATTLRFDREKPAVTDGPYAETKEQLGGIMVLEANDLTHAIRLVSKLPCMRAGGSLEIRPINEGLKIVGMETSTAAV
jgi:hypothetical protein